jgi:acyl-CoA synthetase (AMP-forming)/AMP-acid ligase II
VNGDGTVTIGLLLEMAASGYGSRVALGSGEGGTTFSHLAELARRCCAVLASEKADYAVLLSRNGVIVPTVLFGAAYAGIPFVPLNYRLGRDQIRGLLADFDNPLVVVDEDYLPMVAGSVPTITGTELLAASASATPADLALVDDSAPAVLLFTSGTTSAPKIVPVRHANLQAYVLGTVEFGSANEDDAALVSVPPYHIAAVTSVLSNVYAGRRVVYLPDFDAASWLALARAEQVTSAMVVPTMLARIVGQLAGAEARVPSLQLISYGGARMPIAMLEKALAAFPDAGFVNAYGLTETSSTIALLGPQDHRDAVAAIDPEQRARLGSVGRPVPGIEMQIRGESGAELRPDEVGELWVRGPQVVGEYLGVGSVLDADGWFPTKDRAWLDREGYLFIEGRSDDTIIRGGENIAPAEIEQALLSHPDVADVAVVGVPDDQWGQRLVAVVVSRDGVAGDADDLKHHVRERLRGSRTPDEVNFRDGLPHTATGKLLRHQVVDDLGSV